MLTKYIFLRLALYTILVDGLAPHFDEEERLDGMEGWYICHNSLIFPQPLKRGLFKPPILPFDALKGVEANALESRNCYRVTHVPCQKLLTQTSKSWQKKHITYNCSRRRGNSLLTGVFGDWRHKACVKHETTKPSPGWTKKVCFSFLLFYLSQKMYLHFSPTDCTMCSLYFQTCKKSVSQVTTYALLFFAQAPAFQSQ